jgi:hypothetical protein
MQGTEDFLPLQLALTEASLRMAAKIIDCEDAVCGMA